MSNEEKFKKNMKCLDKWLSNRENNKWIADYLNTCGFSRVGIYGYGILGKHLVHELQKRDFSIKWVMDRSSLGDEVYHNIQRPDNLCELEDGEMAIITSLAAVEDVEALLLQSVTGKVISIEELIDAVYVWGNQY